jgi:hypothetical protein
MAKWGQCAKVDTSLFSHCTSDKGSEALCQVGILLGLVRLPQELTHVSCAPHHQALSTQTYGTRTHRAQPGKVPLGAGVGATPAASA